MKNYFILSYWMLERVYDGPLRQSFDWHIRPDIEAWCGEYLQDYSYERLLIEEGPLHWEGRHVLHVADEDDALLFKIMWMGYSAKEGHVRFVGPVTEDYARSSFRTSSIFDVR